MDLINTEGSSIASFPVLFFTWACFLPSFEKPPTRRVEMAKKDGGDKSANGGAGGAKMCVSRFRRIALFAINPSDTTTFPLTVLRGSKKKKIIKRRIKTKFDNLFDWRWITIIVHDKDEQNFVVVLMVNNIPKRTIDN